MLMFSKATCDIFAFFPPFSPPAALQYTDTTQKAAVAEAGYSPPVLCRSSAHAADQQGPPKAPGCQRQAQHFGLSRALTGSRILQTLEET